MTDTTCDMERGTMNAKRDNGFHKFYVKLKKVQQFGQQRIDTVKYSTLVFILSMNFCNFKSCPLDTPRNPI